VKKTKRNFLERTIGMLAWFGFFLAFFMAFITFFASFSGEENGKEFLGSRMLIVTSDSMSKSQISRDENVFFNSGDLIIIKNVRDLSALKEGDVISFVSESPESWGKTVTHKIKEIRYASDGTITGFVTYGINKGKIDTVPVKPENLIGKYSFKISGLGNFFSFLKSTRGYYLSVLIPAVIIIIFFSVKLGKALGREEFTKAYNEQIEALTKRVGALEEKDSTGAEKIEFDKAPTEESIEKHLNIPRGKKISFQAKLLSLDQSVQAYFNALHNELVSFKRVNSRASFRCISYRFGRILLAKMTIRGKTLNLHLNLVPQAFNQNVFFQRDLAAFKVYREVPLAVKVKSARGLSNALKLVVALGEKFDLTKKQKLGEEQIS